VRPVIRGNHHAGIRGSEHAVASRAIRETRVREIPDAGPVHHLARGHSYKQIGVRLGISARTVESHVGAVLRTLQLSSRHEVTHWAAVGGLIDEDEAETG
jgi:FixJ family two-component response regulator